MILRPTACYFFIHDLAAIFSIVLILAASASSPTLKSPSIRRTSSSATPRERVSINEGWRFWRSEQNPDNIAYDTRSDLSSHENLEVLKPWILPSANDFIADSAKHHVRPSDPPRTNVTYASLLFDDGEWDRIDLPHDWAIQGPFYTGDNAPVTGGMGRLPVHGVGWYRRKLSMKPEDAGKKIYLEVDGAMSYAMVWLNGELVGGWPYGYNSFQLDLTPYLVPGDDNLLAIRVDNPTQSSRWYPGGGVYRNVWLTKIHPTHISQWGTFITTREVSNGSATLDLTVQVENKGEANCEVEIITEVYEIDLDSGLKVEEKIAEFPQSTLDLEAGESKSINTSTTIQNCLLWGPPPSQQPHMYVAITRLLCNNSTIDTYSTTFGIRTLEFHPTDGLLINNEPIRLQGVNQHHDLGALGAAFNLRAAQRQLEILRDLGCNAIRMAHNPPAPELLDLTDRMGFVVIDEIFDNWEREKTPNGFQLIFADWHEPDLRAFLRRDRNHPSVVAWSFGNEVGEQYTDKAGAALARTLRGLLREEDTTRPSTASMNYAKPDMPFPAALDLISLNYQGEGIRDSPAYEHLEGIKTPPQYGAFHEAFPEKLIFSSESAAALSTRGTYLFPVTAEISSPVSDETGGDSRGLRVSAYELYTSDFGASADKVFGSQDRHPFVAGEFVWSGWDYLGEPTPYYSARSSYFGIVDLAGFKKNRYYLYQSRWRPDLKMAHILPHWNWPDRVGEVTPVHVFSAADEAELFLNGVSQGRLQKEEFTYRFRWDEITYEPGELHVVTYKDGEAWANDTMRTTGEAAKLHLTADRTAIFADGYDLAFITTEVLDEEGEWVRSADNAVTFSVSGPGEIVATDNGDPADMVAFPSKERKAFGGLSLVIVKARKGEAGEIKVTASGDGLEDGGIIVESQR
ncbi:hypothetical protein DL769_001057 [Monosporascus sp. CRB-8-3]|nr:hypothetical protein DL769_001057 [Monosporascus sp. CRB-8-3]